MKNHKQKIPKRELNLAWEEYFKDKPQPKNNEDIEKEIKKFQEWYNHTRKQSDTRKTPAEMYKEIYKEDPLKKPNEINRTINFRLNQNYDNELDEFKKEAIEIAEEIFENEIWKDAKKDTKEVSKKEACKSMFSLGFLTYIKLMDEQAEDFQKKTKENPEKFEKAMNEFSKIIKKDEENKDLWNENSFVETLDTNDPNYEERMKYFKENPNDPKEYNCKQCKKPIGKHNLYWHEGMCNNCFFDKHGM